MTSACALPRKLKSKLLTLRKCNATLFHKLLEFLLSIHVHPCPIRMSFDGDDEEECTTSVVSFYWDSKIISVASIVQLGPASSSYTFPGFFTNNLTVFTERISQLLS